jgi:hypothetical protein
MIVALALVLVSREFFVEGLELPQCAFPGGWGGCLCETEGVPRCVAHDQNGARLQVVVTSASHDVRDVNNVNQCYQFRSGSGRAGETFLSSGLQGAGCKRLIGLCDPSIVYPTQCCTVQGCNACSQLDFCDTTTPLPPPPGGALLPVCGINDGVPGFVTDQVDAVGCFCVDGSKRSQTGSYVGVETIARLSMQLSRQYQLRMSTSLRSSLLLLSTRLLLQSSVDWRLCTVGKWKVGAIALRGMRGAILWIQVRIDSATINVSSPST